MLALRRMMGLNFRSKHGRRRGFEQWTRVIDLGEQRVDKLVSGVVRKPLKKKLVDILFCKLKAHVVRDLLTPRNYVH